MLDLYGDRLTLVTGPDGSGWRRAADELAGHGLPVVAVQLGRDVADPTGTAARAYALAAGAAVLVRPDGHIAWRPTRPARCPCPISPPRSTPRSAGSCARAARDLTHRKEHTMTSTTTTRATRGLTALVDRPRPRGAWGRPGPGHGRRRRRALRPALGDLRLLRPDQRVGDPAAYRQHLLHVAGDGAFSLVALVWLPGQATPIHDHLAWCVVGVHEGAEHETRYTARPDGRLVATGSAVAYAGDVDGLLPPGDIHRVTNAGADLAISLHVYGADLSLVGSSIRRRYDDAMVG